MTSRTLPYGFRIVGDCCKLSTSLVERYGLDGDDLLLFFSGSKGFHIGLPTALWLPQPSDDFHRITRRFAETAAERGGVTIDTGVYDRVRAFRAPNSRHPKTGLYKRRLTFDELRGLRAAEIMELAAQPEAFEVFRQPVVNPQAADDWTEAASTVKREAISRQQASRSTSLNRLTLDFIRDGVKDGERHRQLFSAAANLAEFDCPPALAHALLTDPGRDSGLSPKEVRRQIECGLEKGAV